MDFVETAVVCAILLERRRKQKRKLFWVHPIISKRLFDGQFYKLFDSLREHPTKFFNYFRLSIDSFDTLVRLLGRRISYQDTTLRLAVPPQERLSVTLR